jgi:hemerythrin-like domain-containing protein
MKATNELKKEHEGIKLMLRVLQTVAGKIESGERVNIEHFDGILEFLLIFVDKCHHGKEEEFLFPALEVAGVSRKGGPIGVLLAEHAEGRKIISRLKDAFAAYGSGRDSAADEISKAAKEYVSLLSLHIDKENEVLFPMAEGRINEADDVRLVERFEELERERIGQGKHEEFHAMLGRLKEEYLSL